MQSTRYSCPILVKLEFSRQFFEKYSDNKFHENTSIGSRVVPCVQTEGRTDMTKLIVVFFRNFSNAPKNRQTGRWSVTVKSEIGGRLCWKPRSTMDGLQSVRKRIPSPDTTPSVLLQSIVPPSYSLGGLGKSKIHFMLQYK